MGLILIKLKLRLIIVEGLFHSLILIELNADDFDLRILFNWRLRGHKAV